MDRRIFLAPEIGAALSALCGRRTAADCGTVMSMLGLAVLFAFAPASRDLAGSATVLAEKEREERTIPVAASLAALPAVVPEAVTAPTETRSEAREAPTEVVIRKRWDAPSTANPAVISWWDEDHWTAVEEEQARWRSEWLREARRNPERVPLELWPRIVEWAPYDRSLERSARSALGSKRALRRYANSRGRFGPSDRRDLTVDTGEQVRRWANDVLRQLRERASDRRSDRRGRSTSRRPPGG